MIMKHSEGVGQNSAEPVSHKWRNPEPHEPTSPSEPARQSRFLGVSGCAPSACTRFPSAVPVAYM